MGLPGPTSTPQASSGKGVGRQQGSGCRGGARGRPATTGPPPPRLGGAERSGGLAAASPHRPELQLRLQPQKRCLRQCRTRLAPPAAAEPLAQSTPRRPAGSGLGASLAGGPAGQGPPQLGGGERGSRASATPGHGAGADTCCGLSSMLLLLLLLLPSQPSPASRAQAGWAAQTVHPRRSMLAQARGRPAWCSSSWLLQPTPPPPLPPQPGQAIALAAQPPYGAASTHGSGTHPMAVGLVGGRRRRWRGGAIFSAPAELTVAGSCGTRPPPKRGVAGRALATRDWAPLAR